MLWEKLQELTKLLEQNATRHEIVQKLHERSAELFDPATGAWTFTGSFNTPRYYGFTATLLLNGKVLLAGGSGAGTELYDPAGGTWRITGSMTASRSYHTATSLPNGKVLVTGGVNSGSAELYDLVTGTWLLTGQMSTVRSSHTATLLPNGMVLGFWASILLIGVDLVASGAVLAGLCCFIAAVPQLMIAGQGITLWHNGRSLLSAEEIMHALALDERRFEELRERAEAEPVFIVNGRSFYRPSTFADSDKLLRPIDSRNERLLRPATPHSNSEHLVRVADPLVGLSHG